MVWAILVDSHLRNIPVKLFQNLSTDLAEEVVKSLFLFIALAAILFNVAEFFEQFGRGSTKKHSSIIISKSIFFFQEKKSFKGFSIFSSSGHLVQRSRTVWAILVDSHLRNIPVKFFKNLSTDLAEEVIRGFFLFIALAAILFNIAESFEQFR